MTETPWENHLWPVERLHEGETVFILASGPSLTQEVADRLRGHRVMVINSTYKLAPWADVWFFTDNIVYEANKAAVASWPGHIISLSKQAKREMPDKVKRVQVAFAPGFLSGKDGVIRGNPSSGHNAIGLEIALGAKRIVLLGYDMRVVSGREHHHDDYAGRPRDLDIYVRDFLPAFRQFTNGEGRTIPGWNEAALSVGVEIWNATPGSALDEFKMVALDEVLECAMS